jgi:hypothetical protein
MRDEEPSRAGSGDDVRNHHERLATRLRALAADATTARSGLGFWRRRNARNGLLNSPETNRRTLNPHSAWLASLHEPPRFGRHRLHS